MGKRRNTRQTRAVRMSNAKRANQKGAFVFHAEQVREGGTAEVHFFCPPGTSPETSRALQELAAHVREKLEQVAQDEQLWRVAEAEQPRRALQPGSQGHQSPLAEPVTPED